MGLGKIIDMIKHEIDVLKGDENKDKLFSSEHSYTTEHEAELAFGKSVRKLLDVNAWSDLPGISSTFQLNDSMGKPKAGGEPLPGDFICIVLPGLSQENWVQVVDRRVDDTLAEFTVKPSSKPGEIEEGAVKHFFGEEARSTFRVERKGNLIRAFEIGTNERINNQGEEAGDRSVVNTLVAEGGWAFFQKMQWKKLTDYLVHL